MGSMASACVRDCVRSSHEHASEDLLHGPQRLPGLSSSSSPNPGGDDIKVPPVPNWWQVLKDGTKKEVQKETPRFDEVLQSPRPGCMSDQMTPRGDIGGEFRTPGPTPRDSPRPNDDPPPSARGTSNEISYEGTYLGTMKHGTGRLRMNACTYEGDFLNDCKHGNGVLVWDDGRQYRGQFEYGKFHGSALMTWPDGRKYSGQYAEDRKHGEGTFSWQDGRRYQGQWVCGKRHGVGVYTNAKGLTRRGLWQMDRPMHWEVAGRSNSNVEVPSPRSIAVKLEVLESSPEVTAPPPADAAVAPAAPEVTDTTKTSAQMETRPSNVVCTTDGVSNL